MHGLISIGRFAEITRLSAKALRLYDEIGLLRPAFVDPDTGYRYYSITQLPMARRIRLLRTIDMPLEAIHAVVHSPTPRATEEHLRAHQERIAARIARDQQALLLLQLLMDHQADDLAFTVQAKDLPARCVAGIRYRATPEEESDLIPALIAYLEDYAGELGVRSPDEPPMRISHSFSQQVVDSEIAVPVCRCCADTERVTCRALEGGPVASVMHVGPYADLWAVYWAILVWVQERGDEPGGPPREVYWLRPRDGETIMARTEVQWPVHAAQ